MDTSETTSGSSTVETPSGSPIVEAPTVSSTVETLRGSSTVVIVSGVIGSLIVVILAVLLALQLIRMFRKNCNRHTISGKKKYNKK